MTNNKIVVSGRGPQAGLILGISPGGLKNGGGWKKVSRCFFCVATLHPFPTA